VNKLMRSHDFYDNDFFFEFLTFQQIRESCRVFPNALDSNQSTPTQDIKVLPKTFDKIVLNEESTIDDENILKPINLTDNVSQDKEVQLSEIEKKVDCSNESFDECPNDEVYTFGGVVVDQSNEVHEGLISYGTGTTANVVLIRDRICYIANIGDSMAVLFKGGKAIKLNLEHKISVEQERERIFRSGTNIINNRIEGRLNLTRAIGDHMFKKKSFLPNYKQAVIALPEVQKLKITSDMEFIVMGCDGIWDCVEIQDMCEFISKKIKERVPVKQILADMFSVFISKHPHAKIGADNMTCIIIELNNY